MEIKTLEGKKEKDENYTIIEAEYVLLNGEKTKLLNAENDLYKVKLKSEYLDLDLLKDFYITKIHFSVENIDFERFHLFFDDFFSRTERKLAFSKEESEENRITYCIGRIVRKVKLNYD
jgi:hypothetical protein